MQTRGHLTCGDGGGQGRGRTAAFRFSVGDSEQLHANALGPRSLFRGGGKEGVLAERAIAIEVPARWPPPGVWVFRFTSVHPASSGRTEIDRKKVGWLDGTVGDRTEDRRAKLLCTRRGPAR
jgi:hypothetical protein